MTRLYLPHSDIDVSVCNFSKDEYHLMEDVAKLFEESDRYKDVQKIGMAKVPIIKLRDTKYNIPIDISFN